MGSKNKIKQIKNKNDLKRKKSVTLSRGLIKDVNKIRARESVPKIKADEKAPNFSLILEKLARLGIRKYWGLDQ